LQNQYLNTIYKAINHKKHNTQVFIYLFFMKTAYVHCWIQPWWALNVLRDLINEQEHQHQHKIFTVFSDRQQYSTDKYTLQITTALPKRINIFFLRCSNHKIPLLSRLFDYRNLMLFYPILMKILSHKIKDYSPDNIMISSFAIAKNITPISNIPTTLYLHSPMQYIRTHYTEYKEKLTGIKGKIFRRIVPKLRTRDLKFTHFDTVYTNSTYTAQEAKKIYGMQDTIIQYPRISKEFLLHTIQETPLEYYIYVGRLVNFVREADKIIKLFNTMNIPLIMMWSGPDEIYLKSIAGPSIIFIGRINDIHQKTKIISQAKWLINLTKESYGIGTIEAMLLGVPIFGYAQWATTELVDNECGILVENKKHQTLINAFTKFIHTPRNRKLIAQKTREKKLYTQ